jgi:hypothetical protein
LTACFEARVAEVCAVEGDCAEEVTADCADSRGDCDESVVRYEGSRKIPGEEEDHVESFKAH